MGAVGTERVAVAGEGVGVRPAGEANADDDAGPSEPEGARSTKARCSYLLRMNCSSWPSRSDSEDVVGGLRREVR